MKKTLLYSCAAVASLALAACDGDYDDWASPQQNAQEEAVPGMVFSAGPGAANATPEPDSISLVSFTNTNPDVSNVALSSVTVNGTEIAAAWDGSVIKVSSQDLAKVVEASYDSRAAEPRSLEVVSKMSGELADGSVVIAKGTTAATFTTYATPAMATAGYYMLGDFTGIGWNLSTPQWMTDNGDGTYSATVTTTGDNNWFKFYNGAYYSSSDWDYVNQGEMGCAENGDASKHNFLVYTGDPLYEGVQTPVISGAGTWIVTLDMKNLTYTVTSAEYTLWMAGSANGWKQADPLSSNDGDNYTGYMYLDGNGFKFCTQQDWNGTNYGENFSTDGGAANMSLPEGSSEGYYKVDITLSTATLTLTPITAIGVIGDATAGGWSSDTPLSFNKDSRCWEGDVTFADGTFKFRANGGWDINWGGSLDDLTAGGSDIAVSAGTYHVAIYPNCPGKAYATLTAK